MLKMKHICCVLPADTLKLHALKRCVLKFRVPGRCALAGYALMACALAPAPALAVDTATVELMAVETGTVVSPAVDSALSESMQADSPEQARESTMRKRLVLAPPDPVWGAPVENHRPAAAPAPAPHDRSAVLAPAGDRNYVIQPGDVLQITVWKEADMDREVLVLPDGTVSFPLIGSFRAEGQTPAQVQSLIRQKLQNLIPDASVTVLVKAALGHAVSVIGQVAKPGELVMNHQLTVMQALSQAGGLTPFASEGGIIILRRVNGKETSIAFPYDEVVRGRSLDRNIALLPGDVVVVPTASLF